ncbi:programmed cell death 6-interacting protein [Aplysia californica]|uniref:Programmed cell death 6-interacting protein n=1 Tax=Aplysia californica TaxID=6500 RepID=A0ABM0ZX03_APLCA|nr:programmed cell death 6-interacting protein [Aplysia californica]
MASFIAVPLKKTYEVDFVKPLRTFIQNTFTQADPDDYNQALSEFNKLRTTMITKSVDKHESALEVLYRYYDQLVAIENKLPIAENQIRVQFKWRDAFDEGSFLSGKRNLAIASAAYEKVCVLYNIAALQSQIAAIQNHDNNEGLKLTVKLFQQACGIFGHLKDVVLSHVQQDPTPDLNPDTLSALSALMLAQAQESIYRKATQDKMKESMVAKLAYQTSELYSDAMKLMQLGSIRELWPKDWLPTVVMKQAGFHGMSEFYQSCVAQQNKSYGEEIARLQHCMELLNASATRGGTTFNFRQEQARGQRALESAKKDNDFIYHDKIPDLKTLDPIGKAVVAKSASVAQPMSTKFVDLFEKIVPLPVHEALTTFENRKSQLVNMEVGRLREATQLINSVLASLNLPAALEDLSGERVPQSLLDKAQQVQEMGGLARIDQLMSDLPELLNRNREILTESMKSLDDEEKSDQQLREQFKDKWSRTASGALTKPMRDEAGKYKSILDTAIQADHIVKQKYDTHKNAIALLSKPKGDIESALPAASAAASMQNSDVVKTLRDLIEQVSTIKAERDVIESELKEAKFDMSGKFFQALATEGLINEEPLSASELDRVYSPLREQVSDSIHRQEAVLSQIQNSNTEFTNAKSSNQNAAQRETMLKDLAAGYDSFMELKGNLEEGTKFYNDLTPLLVRLQTKINDFCFARKTEKDELMADLQKAIANTPAQAPPVAPRYQGGSGQQQSTQDTSSPSAAPGAPTAAPRGVPPPRPPPPSAPSTAGPNSAITGATKPSPSAAAAASAPPPGGVPTGLPYSPNPTQPGHGQPPYGGGYPGAGAPGAGPGQWQAPYPGYPGQGYPMPQMPAGYNPYNPYMGYPHQPPAAGYPQQQPPGGYPQQQPPQGYPQQQPPQGYPGQAAPPYPQQGYPYPGYPPQQQYP